MLELTNNGTNSSHVFKHLESIYKALIWAEHLEKIAIFHVALLNFLLIYKVLLTSTSF